MTNTKRIEQARELLKMIEGLTSVNGISPEMVKANRIFWCLLQDKKWKGFYIDGDDAYVNEDGSINYIGVHYQPYASSRDALKAARPEGVMFEMSHSPGLGGFRCKISFGNGRSEPNIFTSPWYRSNASPGAVGSGFTECLAEFHCIVQAWIYVWENE